MVAPDTSWLQTIDGNQNDFGISCCEAVYGFKNDQKATFDVFCTLINSTSSYNIQQFQLSYGNNLPTGPFDSIGTFTTVNARLLKTPYQEFSFPKVTAKYFKIKLISNYDTYEWNAAEFQLWGKLK